MLVYIDVKGVPLQSWPEAYGRRWQPVTKHRIDPCDDRTAAASR